MRRSTLRTGAAASALALALAGCADSGPDDSAAAVSGPHVTAAQQLVASALKPQTFDELKPRTPAPPFPKGKRIAIVMSTARTVANHLQANGFEKAAAAVGWTWTEFDGQGTNQGKITAMRTALSQGFDGIYLTATDQRILSDPMREAHERGIPVVSSISGNQPGTDPGQVFADVGLDGREDGQKIASWIIADAAASGVSPKVIWFENRVNEVVLSRDDGMDATFKACGSACRILAREQYTSAEVAQAVPQRMQALLQRHPDANYAVIDVGPYATYVAQGIKQLGGEFARRIKLASFDCVPDQVKRIVEEDIDRACSGAGSEYAGWAAADEMNRAFNKQPPAGNRVPVQLVTKDNHAGVTTPDAGYTGGFDYAAAWKKFWGVE